MSELPVDVGEVGHITGSHHPIEELHGLHGCCCLCPQKQGSGEEECNSLEHHNRLVSQPVSQQEHRH